jgi:hypothetical protein
MWLRLAIQVLTVLLVAGCARDSAAPAAVSTTERLPPEVTGNPAAANPQAIGANARQRLRGTNGKVIPGSPSR